MAAPWYSLDPQRHCLSLTVHVQPNARSEGVAGLHGDALKVKVAAAAVDGKANAGLLDVLARAFAVPRRQVSLKQGARSRRKVVEVCGSAFSPEDLLGREGSKRP